VFRATESNTDLCLRHHALVAALHKKFKIPPTEVGGSFRSFLRNAFHRRHSQIPPTAVGGCFRSFLPRRRI